MIQPLIEKIMYKWLKNHRKLFFIVQIIYRIIKKDKEFVNAIIDWENQPNYLRIMHNGKDNTGKIIYIVREQGNGYGFFAEFKNLLEKLLYAEMHGFIPYIFFGDNFLYYDKTIEYEKNAFNYFFESKVEVINPFHSENIVYSKGCHIDYIEEQFNALCYSTPIEYEKKLAYVFNKYFIIKNDLITEFNTTNEQIFGDKKILGIHYRGTDFKVGYNNHPIAVRVEQVIAEAEEAFEKHEFQGIFLATDEKGIYEILSKHFVGKVVWYEDTYRGETNKSIAFSNEDRENHKYNLGKEVLRDAYALSKCDGLIAGLSQVSFGARIIKKSRDEEYLYYKCIYNGMNQSKQEFNMKKN